MKWLDKLRADKVALDKVSNTIVDGVVPKKQSEYEIDREDREKNITAEQREYETERANKELEKLKRIIEWVSRKDDADYEDAGYEDYKDYEDDEDEAEAEADEEDYDDLLLETEQKYDSYEGTIEHTPTKEDSEPFITKNTIIFTNKAIITTTNEGLKVRYTYASMECKVLFETTNSPTNIGIFYITAPNATLKLGMTLKQFKKLNIINTFKEDYIYFATKI